MDLKFQIVRNRVQLTAIADEWRDLWARSHGDYYLSFESVLQSWDAIHAPKGRRMCCTLAREGTTLVGILPMIAYRRSLWRIASPLGPEAAEGADVLQEEGAEPEIAGALLRYFVAEIKPDVVAFAFVRSSSALDRTILGCEFSPVITYKGTIPYANLSNETSWEGYDRSLSRSTQREIGRKQRRMQEAGTVEFEIVEGAADASIDWLLDEKAKWGRKVGKVGPWLFSASYRSYLKKYAAQDMNVFTCTLRFNGATAAVKVISVAPTLCTLIIAAYDEKLRHFSPGNILDRVWIRHVFDTFERPDGRRIDINFGTGDEEYKTHWGRGFSFISTTYKLPVSRWGRLPYVLKAAKSAILPSRRFLPH